LTGLIDEVAFIRLKNDRLAFALPVATENGAKKDGTIFGAIEILLK